jgi:hypothetical protein
LFRRKIPLDLKIRFPGNEIIRSLGDSRAGEARRLAYGLWFETEVLFMRLRHLSPNASPAETSEAAAQILSSLDAMFKREQAAVEPDVPLEQVQEPANRAVLLKGLAAAAKNMAGKNDVAALADVVLPIFDPEAEAESLPAARVVARKIATGLPDAAQRAADGFAELGMFRPAVELPFGLKPGRTLDIAGGSISFDFRRFDDENRRKNNCGAAPGR